MCNSTTTKETHDWVVFDLETTGLSPQIDSIIQIAAVRMRGGRVVAGEAFSTFVDPLRSIPAWITQYTGIRNSDVTGAPPTGRALAAFSQFVGHSTLVAHNGHRFDMKFLASGCQKERLMTRAVTYHDSLGLSWEVWGRQGMRHGLDAVLSRLDLMDHGLRRHDARGDVELLARAIEKMCDRLQENGRSGVLGALRRYEGSLPQVP